MQASINVFQGKVTLMMVLGCDDGNHKPTFSLKWIKKNVINRRGLLFIKLEWAFKYLLMSLNKHLHFCAAPSVQGNPGIPRY